MHREVWCLQYIWLWRLGLQKETIKNFDFEGKNLFLCEGQENLFSRENNPHSYFDTNAFCLQRTQPHSPHVGSQEQNKRLTRTLGLRVERPSP